MNEVIKGRNLVAEILARAASIKGAMSDVNARLASMQALEAQARAKAELEEQAAAAAAAAALTELPDDVLLHVAKRLRHYESLRALSQTCKRLQALVNSDAAGWERMCRDDWGIREPAPRMVPVLGSILSPNASSGGSSSSSNGSSSTYEDPWLAEDLRGRSPLSPTGPGVLGGGVGGMGSVARLASLVATTGGSSIRARHASGGGDGGAATVAAVAARGAGQSASNAAASSSAAGGSSSAAAASTAAASAATSGAVPSPTTARPSLWRNIYRDRAQGWRMVRSVLKWLQDHQHPRSVTGSLHRLQLHLALRYMELGTGHPQDAARRQVVLQSAGLQSLLALLDNDSGGVQELALSVLANLIYGDSDTKVQVQVGSRMGKLMCDKLDETKIPGVGKQASRALVNLWAEGVVPEVVPLLPDNQPARPTLQAGYWQLQEFSLRGESFSLVHMSLSFDEGGRVVRGHGCDRLGDVWEEFEVSGSVDIERGEWRLQRRLVGVDHVIQYSGHCDLHGAWGVFQRSPSAGSSMSCFWLGSGRQPRVFRLFRDPSLPPPYVAPTAAAAVEEEALWAEEEEEEVEGLVGQDVAGEAALGGGGLQEAGEEGERTASEAGDGGGQDEAVLEAGLDEQEGGEVPPVGPAAARLQPGCSSNSGGEGRGAGRAAVAEGSVCGDAGREPEVGPAQHAGTEGVDFALGAGPLIEHGEVRHTAGEAHQAGAPTWSVDSGVARSSAPAAVRRATGALGGDN